MLRTELQGFIIGSSFAIFWLDRRQNLNNFAPWNKSNSEGNTKQWNQWNHSQRYWERAAECVIIFGKYLTAMRPVALLIICTLVFHLQGRMVYSLSWLRSMVILVSDGVWPFSKYCNYLSLSLHGEFCSLFNYTHQQMGGTAVAQWLRCCATNRKVASSIPAGVIGIFHWHKILPIALWPWGRLSL